jgi:hypothetical protein
LSAAEAVNVVVVAVLVLLVPAGAGWASTYVVYIPLDSPIYGELDTLDGLGVLDTYISEIKPISRVEAARLVIEAEHNLAEPESTNTLARAIVDNLRLQLSDEVGWLERNVENDQPATLHPVDRAEVEYVFSRGKPRQFSRIGGDGEQLQATEATPLIPNNNDLPTSAGSNEVLRVSGWGGVGGFLTAYGEGAVAGPITRSPTGFGDQTVSRVRLLRGEIVASLGNTAISWGQQEMAWGVGHYSSLSQGPNAQAFPALRVGNIHPGYLPGIFRYLGPFSGQAFFGQLDHDRVYSRPWLSGQILSFKPLPTLEIGGTHVVMFGGRSNDNYSLGGFLGRATGFSTGSGQNGNTNSRSGIFVKLRIPKLRDAIVYQEILGEDDATYEVPGVGRWLPFIAVSYQGGIYLPRLTEDGQTTARFEYVIKSYRDSLHSDSLYWTYKGRLMGDPMGPDASKLDVGLGRWFHDRYKADLDLFYTERAPDIGPQGGSGVSKERSGGLAVELLQLPIKLQGLGGIGEMRARATTEYVDNINFVTGGSSLRIGVQLTATFSPGWSWSWR